MGGKEEGRERGVRGGGDQARLTESARSRKSAEPLAAVGALAPVGEEGVVVVAAAIIATGLRGRQSMCDKEGKSDKEHDGGGERGWVDDRERARGETASVSRGRSGVSQFAGKGVWPRRGV